MHACTHTSSRYGCARPTDRERSHRIVEESGLTHGRRVAYLYAGGNDRYGFVSFRLGTFLVALLFFYNFTGFRVYHSRSAGVESLRREHRACNVDSVQTGTRTTTMYPMAFRFFEFDAISSKNTLPVQRFVVFFRTILKRNVSR